MMWIKNLFRKKYRFGRPSTLNSLEERICDIETPYKYQIGDPIYESCQPFGREIKTDIGKVVDRKFNYQYNFCNSGRYRSNWYLIYFEDNKESYWTDEHSIIQVPPKPKPATRKRK